MVVSKYHLAKKKVKIITIVREPISRNISAFFQNIKIFIDEKYENQYKPNRYAQILFEKFLGEYPHETPLNWFDVEMKEITGIDIYKYPFRKEADYSIINHNNIELLIIKLELDDPTKQKIITNFLNMPDIKLTRTNIGKEKGYSELYQNFKKKIRLPKSYIKKMLLSEYATHFYTDIELKKFQAKWETKGKNQSNV